MQPGAHSRYHPAARRGSFRSSDDLINRIWDVSARTLELNTREFYFDGIKRDRWVWSGDANQSYLMNYYLAFDQGTVQRTMWALRGKDPVEQHINTIVDYSFYWFVSIYDYYLFTGDKELVQRMYPRMKSLMDFVLARRNRNGLVEGLPGDWVFIDWPPQEMPKDGELSAEQLLFARSLEAMALCARLVGDSRADEYRLLASSVPPLAAPAPMRVWISSMNRMAWGLSLSDLSTPLRRCSKSPRYLVPASKAPISKE